MNKDAFDEVWQSRLAATAMELQRQSGAGAVLVAIFDGPWMSGKDPAILGMAGAQKADPFRIARDLQVVVDALKRNAESITEGKPFTEERKAEPPQRD